MLNWKEYRFSDFTTINPTVSLKGTDEYSFVEMKDLQDGNKVCSPSAKRKTSSGARFQERDTLFARITPCLENGKICQVRNLENGVGFGSTEFLVFRGKEDVSDNEFVFYLSRWNEVRDFAESNFEGTSGRQRVPKNCFENLKLDLPALPEQTAIANILSSLDDKIDLLHRQNKTLEQLAETLFRQWFVEDAKIDIVPLKKYVEVIDNRGKTPPFSDVKTDYPIVEVKSLSNNDRFVNYDACEKYVNEETYNNWFRKGHPIINDILISTVGSIGEMAYVIENKGGIAQNVIGLRAKGISPYYLYQYLSLPKTRNLIKDLDIGAVQPSIKVPHLLDLEIPIPKDIKLVMEFEMQLIPIFEKMKVNHFQIKTLTQTRETLLPKLMSGEVRVEI